MSHAEVTRAFNPYRIQVGHELREPDLRNKRADDEMYPIDPKERCLLGDQNPGRCIKEGTKAPPDESCKYLWVVMSEEVVFALENGPAGKATSRGTLTHTNITSGQPAHSGGEVWFANSRRLMFNGKSSRYRPRTGIEMAELLRSFLDAGFEAISWGWNEDTNEPRMRCPWETLSWPA
jgi:hypothetical protein